MRTIETSNMPKSNGHYSQCIEHDGILYLSGQLPLDKKDKTIPKTIEEQTQMVLENMETILKEAKSCKENVLKINIYISDIGLWDRVNSVYGAFFKNHKPVRCVVPVEKLHFGCMIEMEATAVSSFATKYKSSLDKTHQRIKPYIHNTPVLTSKQLNDLVGAEIFFKCENFQKMGAFKMRGAANAIMQLSSEQKSKGVVTHSSGNFAQALSLAAKSLGIKAYIVMPNTAPQVKKDAVRGYGGEIVECESNLAVREYETKKIQEEKGATFIHPSDDIDVILGQGTSCKELLEAHPNLEYVFSPVGGGGLVAGTILAAGAYGSSCKVVGGEPKEADDAYRSLKSGVIESNTTTNTIADGLKTQLGDINFPIIKHGIEKIVLVTEDEIISAMRLIWERLKIICEPSSAVAFAALLKEKESYKNKKVGIIISGGNVDLSNLPF